MNLLTVSQLLMTNWNSKWSSNRFWYRNWRRRI